MTWAILEYAFIICSLIAGLVDDHKILATYFMGAAIYCHLKKREEKDNKD